MYSIQPALIWYIVRLIWIESVWGLIWSVCNVKAACHLNKEITLSSRSKHYLDPRILL